MTEKLAAEIVKKSGTMRDTGMTSATPKPRAGEHTPETDAHVKWMREEGSSSSCLPELALAEFARRIEVERDLSFSREAQLVTALRGIVRRYEAQWSDEPEELSAARALLAKHGR